MHCLHPAPTLSLLPTLTCSNTDSLLALRRCTVSGRELTMQLGKGAVLVPEQDSLALLPNQAVLYDVLDPTARFSGSRAVAMCSSCQPPQAAIAGPSVSPFLLTYRHAAVVKGGGCILL